MQVNFMDPNSQPLQAPVMPTQNQGLAQLDMPGQQKREGMQFSPDQIQKLADMLKGFGQSGEGQLNGLSLAPGQGIQPNLQMAGGMGGGGGILGGMGNGISGSLPSFGGFGGS